MILARLGSTFTKVLKMADKTLILFRGIPGSGKSTAADLLVEHNVAADDYFDLFHGGQFKGDLLREAHKWCQNVAGGWMSQRVDKVGVHNTFTRIREMRPYFQMAEKHGYRVISLIVENRHGSLSVHDVPEETVERMKGRFDIQL